MIIRFPNMVNEKWLDHKDIADSLGLRPARTAQLLQAIRLQLDEMTAADGIERYRPVGRSYLYAPIALELARQRETKRGAKPKKTA
jgi:hypothetical protein